MKAEMMNAEITIRRAEAGGRESRWEKYTAACTGKSTVAALLAQINETAEDPVDWECSCREGRCGACAMVINGVPRLACAVFVQDIGTRIRLEPLSKFPLIRDLRVDREGIRRLLEKVKSYPLEHAEADSRDSERQYLASSCLLCGCCLEVCPEYTGKDDFGSALLVNCLYRTISQEKDPERRRELKKTYDRNHAANCSKALSCAAVCPMNLPQASIMSRLNAVLPKHGQTL